MKHAHGKLDALRPLAVLASEILAYDRAELIQYEEKASDEWGGLLKAFGEGAKDAKALSEILGNAQARLLVAVALAGIPPPSKVA